MAEERGRRQRGDRSGGEMWCRRGRRRRTGTWISAGGTLCQVRVGVGGEDYRQRQHRGGQGGNSGTGGRRVGLMGRQSWRGSWRSHKDDAHGRKKHAQRGRRGRVVPYYATGCAKGDPLYYTNCTSFAWQVHTSMPSCVLAVWDCSRRIWISNYEADPECPT
jgi:hypothetical protein